MSAAEQNPDQAGMPPRRCVRNPKEELILKRNRSWKILWENRTLAQTQIQREISCALPYLAKAASYYNARNV